MSKYLNYDHAGWVQAQIAASKPRALKSKSQLRKAREDSKGWAAAPDELNDFQKRTFNILGIVGGGIYNAPIGWGSIYWRPKTIIVSWYGSVSTWDHQALTQFVFLCHEARFRGSVQAVARGYFEIALSERRAGGDIAERHPGLQEAVNAWCEEFPSDHSIVYRPKPIPESSGGFSRTAQPAQASVRERAS